MENSQGPHMNTKKSPRVLSIQSHVVSGYVGNKSATFPLQLLGFDVDAINSVQLSNHTGYKVVRGQVLNEKDLSELAEGLAANDLDKYTHLLTGYIGSASFLKRIAQLVRDLRKKNPDLIYVCDTVMGDNGKMYVPAELKDIYRDDIVPLADIITPNQYELELLTGKTTCSIEDVKDGIKTLHEKGPQIVAVSSTDIDDKLTAIVSVLKDAKVMMIDIPRINTSFIGSGDLFAALFLAHSYLEDDVKVVLEKTVNTLHEILLQTFEISEANIEEEAQSVRKIELRLIQNKRVIENPQIKLFAKDM